jgi:FAD:protein FMN transferase
MNHLQKRMRPLLGTFVEVAIAGQSHTSQVSIPPPSAAQARVNAAFAAAFTRVELIQQLLSFHDLASDLSRLNAAQGKATPCHLLSLKCLRLAKAITRASAGRFNCTLGAALTQRQLLPSHHYEQLYGERLLDSGDWRDIDLTATGAALARPVLITLDGIAKGFAVDSAIAELKRFGVNSGWINAGGDIRVFGDLVLPIAVRDHQGKEHLLGGLQNAAIATSTSIATPDFPGVLLAGRGQSLPPMTSTVIARSAWRADALTKVAAATPAPERAEYLATLGGRWIPL